MEKHGKKNSDIEKKKTHLLKRVVIFSSAIFLFALVGLGISYWYIDMYKAGEVIISDTKQVTETTERVIEKEEITEENTGTGETVEKEQETKTKVTNNTQETKQEEAKETVQKTPVNEEQKPEETPPVIHTLNYTFGLAMAEELSVVSKTELKDILDDLTSLGVGWIRVDLSWNTIQWGGENEYNWEAFDAIVLEASKRNIRVLPIVTYTPRWARKSSCSYTSKCEPRDPQQFANFAQKAVERYSPKGVTVWEVWNEPNIRKFWAEGANAKSYTQLLKLSYTAIHEADEDAVVISGGLAPTATGNGRVAPLEYLEQMYENGAKNYFDALGFHPYSYSYGPNDYRKTNAWSQMNETKVSVRSIMKKYGDGNKKIWLTEYGAPTWGPGETTADNNFLWWKAPTHITESYQAEMLEDAYEYVDDVSWDGPLFWYSYRDIGTDASDVENFFGILRYNGYKKPAYTTLQKILQ